MTKPNRNDFTYLDKLKYSTKILIETSKQIKKEIEYDPENQEPILARAYLLLNYGNDAGKKVGLQELQRCLGMKPDLSIEHSSYARILFSKGLKNEALLEIEKALSLNPHDLSALKLKEKLK